MKNRKKREITATDYLTIEENVKNTTYSESDKERLKLQAIRLNEEMVNQQIGIPELVEITGMGQGTIGQYKTGKVLIKEDLLQPLCDALHVSRNYLRGISKVRRYENEELNKLFGLTDNAIDNLSTMPNKDLINILFDNDRDDVLYFFEKLDEYKKELDKFNKESSISLMAGTFQRDSLNIAKYRLMEAFSDLINKK